MMLFEWISRKAARRQAARILYQAALTQSRDPVFYADLGVADTMDGRFDLLSLHVYMMIERLEQLGPEGRRLAQALFDCLFVQMDRTLRESGVGDLSVPRHVKKMMTAFNGRAHGYHAALAAGDFAALEQAVSRNVFREEAGRIPGGAGAIASYVLETAHRFCLYGLDDFMKGAVVFPAVSGEGQKEAAHA